MIMMNKAGYIYIASFNRDTIFPPATFPPGGISAVFSAVISGGMYGGNSAGNYGGNSAVISAGKLFPLQFSGLK